MAAMPQPALSMWQAGRLDPPLLCCCQLPAAAVAAPAQQGMRFAFFYPGLLWVVGWLGW